MADCKDPNYSEHVPPQRVHVTYYDDDWEELEHLSVKEATPHEAAMMLGLWLKHLDEGGSASPFHEAHFYHVAAMTLEVQRG